MVVPDVLFALVITFLLVWIFSKLFDTRGPGDKLVWFFLLVFLFVWAGGLWITPIGPLWWGVSWVPALAVGLFVVLLLTAIAPEPSRHRKEARAQAVAEETVEEVLGIFFWILITLLILSIVGRYFFWPRPVI
jgi:hypothetical protein